MRNPIGLAAGFFALAAALTPVAAVADSPTHVFQIYSATTAKGASACMMKASLTLLKRTSRQAIEIDFKSSNPNGAPIAFAFSKFGRSKARTAAANVEGLGCKTLTLTSPSLLCPDSKGACVGAVRVDVKARKSPGVKAEQISN